jgi:hypothetical protein
MKIPGMDTALSAFNQVKQTVTGLRSELDNTPRSHHHTGIRNDRATQYARAVRRLEARYS